MAPKRGLNTSITKDITIRSCEINETEVLVTREVHITRTVETQEEFPDPSESSGCESTDSCMDENWTDELSRYVRIKTYQYKYYFQSKPLPFKIISSSISFLLLVILVGLYMKFSSQPNLWKDDLNIILRKYPSLYAADRSAIVFTFEDVLENQNVEVHGFLTKTILLSGRNSDKLLRELQRFVKIHFNPEIREPITLDENTRRADLHDTVETGINSSKSGPGVMGLMGIDKMLWDAPLVLHAFCDPDVNENANRVNLLSMSQATKNKKSCEEQALRVLTNTWKATGGNADNIPPILSRIDYIICL
ncbi:unnamed protein product [Auanema sp. JU1783]|nr:unnamed protein product [Auanema sp. JU1783]